MIVFMAANGLAEIEDKDSIPFIIEACRRSPDFASGIAELSLSFFDDPQAQAAVETYVGPERAKKWREKRARGLRPFGHE